MGKPVGTYLTLEAPELAKEDESYHQEASAELGEQLLSLVQKCCPDNPKPRILIAGLGNLQVTQGGGAASDDAPSEYGV